VLGYAGHLLVRGSVRQWGFGWQDGTRPGPFGAFMPWWSGTAT